MMNKVLLVGELISNKVIAKNSQGTVNAFIIATVRVPKDSRREKEVHFLYCKALWKKHSQHLRTGEYWRHPVSQWSISHDFFN